MIAASAAGALRAIERKLERWELEHLREHALQLAARVEELQRDLDIARDRADDADRRAEYWHDQVMRLEEDLAEDVRIGLTAEGEMSLIWDGAQQASGSAS